MSMRQSWIQCLISLAAMATLVGCSALQIDVDVYKGPLVSQREVQLRQFAALAMAAKPLLTSLRDEAEGPPWIESEEARRDAGFSKHDFTDPLARFTNGVLSYYDDLPPPDISMHASAVQRRSDLYRNALKDFNPVGDDCLLAKYVRDEQTDNQNGALKGAMISFLQAGEQRPTISGGKCARIPPTPPSTNGPSRKLEKLQSVWNQLCESYRLPVVPSPEAGVVQKACGSVSAKGVNKGYYLLAEGTWSKALAAVIFPDSKAKANKLAERLTQVGVFFVEGRRQLTGILESAIDLLEATGTQGTERQLNAAVTMVVNATQVRVLQCVLETSGQSLPASTKELRRGLWVKADWIAQRDKAYDDAQAALFQQAHDRPIETAKFLRLVHARMLHNDTAAIKPGRCAAYAPEDPNEKDAWVPLEDAYYAWQLHGLARGTQTDNGLDTALNQVSEELGSVVLPAAVGFDQGRTARGLEALTRFYLEAVQRKSGEGELESQEVKETRRQLEELLIAFAERVLYVVNNYDQLPAKAIKGDAGGAGADTFSNEMRPEQEARRSQQLKDYTALFSRRGSVLQSVGNTIIVLVDDIRRQSDHDAHLAARSEAELLAVRGAFDLTLPQVYDKLTREVSAAIERDSAQIQALRATQAPLSQTQPDLEKDVGQLNDEAVLNEGAREDARQKLTQARQDGAPLLAAFRTFVSVEKSPALSAALPMDKALVKDRAAWYQQLLHLGSDAAVGAVLDESIAFIDGQLNAVKPNEKNAPRTQRLSLAKQYLTVHRGEFDGITATGLGPIKSEMVKLIQKKFDDSAQEAKTLAETLRSTAQTAKAARDKATAKDKVWRTETARLATVQDAINVATASQTSRERTLQVLSDIRGEVFAQVSSPTADGQTLLAAMKVVVQKKIDAITDKSEAGNAERAKLTDAKQHLGRVQLQDTPKFLSRPASAAANQRSQKDVLDDLIASLRQRQIAAAAEGRSTQELDKALQIAYEQRAGMAYLRPASAYLRNVYAATSLIDRADLDRHNLLIPAWMRTAIDPHSLQSRLDIEKQFWQNINTVSLQGAAASNYVIVKDDVGNWYVKAYVSDPTTIIQSAQNLALFNMGAKLDVDLLRRLELQRRVDDRQLSGEERGRAREDLKALTQNGAVIGGAGVAGLKRVQQRYADDYAKQTVLDASGLKSSLSNLKSDLRAAWERDLKADEENTTVLANLGPYYNDDADEVKAALKALNDAEASKPDEKAGETQQKAYAGRLADAIVDGLRQVKRMRLRLVAAIQKQANLVDSAEQAVKTARESLAQVQKVDLVALDADVKSKEAAVRAADKNDESAIGKANDDLTTARDKLSTSQQALANAKQVLTDAKVARDAAFSVRRTAADTASNLLSNTIASLANRRIESVKQLETAIGFIGEVASEK